MSNIFSSKSHFVQPNVVCLAPAVAAVPTFWSPVADTLEFIAGDSTNSNTGYKGGLFHFLEKYLDRSLDSLGKLTVHSLEMR